MEGGVEVGENVVRVSLKLIRIVTPWQFVGEG
jgi:hypothetical protein